MQSGRFKSLYLPAGALPGGGIPGGLAAHLLPNTQLVLQDRCWRRGAHPSDAACPRRCRCSPGRSRSSLRSGPAQHPASGCVSPPWFSATWSLLVPAQSCGAASKGLLEPGAAPSARHSCPVAVEPSPLPTQAAARHPLHFGHRCGQIWVSLPKPLPLLAVLLLTNSRDGRAWPCLPRPELPSSAGRPYGLCLLSLAAAQSGRAAAGARVPLAQGWRVGFRGSRGGAGFRACF